MLSFNKCVSFNNNTTMTFIHNLFIPMVFPNINEDTIRRVIQDQLGLVRIETVEFDWHTNENTGKQYKSAQIHILRWNTSPNATRVHEKLQKGEQVQIMYDAPWYWWIRAQTIATVPTINFDAEPTPPPIPEHVQIDILLDEIDEANEDPQDQFLREIEFLNRGPIDDLGELEDNMQECMEAIDDIEHQKHFPSLPVRCNVSKFPLLPTKNITTFP